MHFWRRRIGARCPRSVRPLCRPNSWAPRRPSFSAVGGGSLPGPSLFCPGNDIRSTLHGDGPLRIFSDGDAGNAQTRCFFLDASGIGHDDRCMLHQTQKIQIRQGIGQHDSRAGVSGSFCISARLGGIRSGREIQTEILNALPRSGMDGKYDGKILRQFLQTRKNAQKTIPIVHIRWAMQSQQRVRANWFAVLHGP